MRFIEPSKTRIREALDKLTSETEAQWGMMTPQHMVEHLTMTLRNASGELPLEQATPDEKLPKLQQFLYSEDPMPKEQKVPFMPKEELPERREPDLETAKEKLLEAWEAFEEHFEKAPEKRTVHPVFGPLDREGWYQVHRKHFTHHFDQFGLL